MRERITNEHLNQLCRILNTMTDSPLEPYTRDDNGFRANIGNYHIDYAYGGVELVRMMTERGGVYTPLSTGHYPKRELYNRIQAFIAGMREAERLR